MFEAVKNIIIKPTRDCNLNCTYCHMLDKSAYRGELMTFDLYKKIIDKIVVDKQKSSGPFSLVLHGGEPTLLGSKNIFKFYDYAYTKFQENKFEFTFGIQTNGSLVDEEMMNIFKRFNVGVGVSYDGLKELNRFRTNTVDYQKITKFFRNHNFSYGVITCISEVNKKQIKKLLQSSNIKFSKTIDVADTGGVEISPAEMFKYVYKEIVDYFIKKGKIWDRGMEILFWKTLQSFILEKETKEYEKFTEVCEVKYCGGGVTVMSIDPDGKVLRCGRASGRDDEILGHVLDYDFLGITLKKHAISFLKNRDIALRKKGCDLCYMDGVCRYWCMAFVKTLYNDFTHLPKNNMCEEYKLFYNYVSQRQIEILKKAAEINYDIPLLGTNFIFKKGIKKLADQLDIRFVLEDNILKIRGRNV